MLNFFLIIYEKLVALMVIIQYILLIAIMYILKLILEILFRFKLEQVIICLIDIAFIAKSLFFSVRQGYFLGEGTRKTLKVEIVSRCLYRWGANSCLCCLDVAVAQSVPIGVTTGGGQFTSHMKALPCLLPPI